MKIKLLFAVLSTILLTGCPSEKEVKEMMNELKEKRSKASEIIRSKNLTTENLLEAQEYFFEFSEKVHLIKVDEKSAERVRKMIDKLGVTNFCKTFLLSKEELKGLNEFCGMGDSYNCSYEMRDYAKVVEKLTSLLGVNYVKVFKSVPVCNY